MANSFLQSSGFADRYKKVPLGASNSGTKWQPDLNNAKTLMLNSPQSFIKVISYGHDAKSVHNILDYISREGELTLHSSEGLEYNGKDDINAIMDEWKEDFEYAEYQRERNNGKKHQARVAMHMVISMPKFATKDDMSVIAKEFAKAEFDDRFDYVYAIHTDREHPHAHFVVNSYGYNGKKLRVEKDDLAAWRGRVAEVSLEHTGILLDHSPCTARGATPQKPKLARQQAAKRNELLDRDKREIEQAKNDAKAGVVGKDPETQKLRKKHKTMIEKLSSFTEELDSKKDDLSEDEKSILDKFKDHVNNLTAPLSGRAKLARQFRSINKEKTMDKENKDRDLEYGD